MYMRGVPEGGLVVRTGGTVNQDTTSLLRATVVYIGYTELSFYYAVQEELHHGERRHNINIKT